MLLGPSFRHRPTVQVVVGALLALGILATACISTPEPTPTPAPTVSATASATATLTSTPTATMTATPTSTATATATATATLTPTPSPTPTFTPTPPPAPETLLPTAGPMCTAAFQTRVGTGVPRYPVFAIERTPFADDPGWQATDYLPHAARSALDVRTLVCLQASREQVGTYTDGQPGYRVDWDVRLVSWPDGAVIGQNAFTGAHPPLQKRGTAPGFGLRPARSLSDWLLPLLADKPFLYAAGGVEALAFSPDGATLALGVGSRVKLWDMRSGQVAMVLEGHEDQVNDVAFSPDGTLLASGSGDSVVKEDHDYTVRIWDVATGRMQRTLDGHTLQVYGVSFSPDGTVLASGSRDGTVRLWDVRTGKTIRTLDAHKYVFSLAFSPDGRVLATGGDGEAKLWEVETGRELFALPSYGQWVQGVAFSPDGTILATGSDAKSGTSTKESRTVVLWDVATGQELRILGGGPRHWTSDVAFSPDGTLLAAGAGAGGEEALLLDVETGAVLRTFEHDGSVNCVAFSPDGRLLASGSFDATVGLWDVEVK